MTTQQEKQKQERVTRATVKMWKKIGEAFRDWAKEVGAREFADAAVDQFNDAVDVVSKKARQYGPSAYRTKKKKKKNKGSKKKSSSKKSGKRKGGKKRRSGSKRKKG